MEPIAVTVHALRETGFVPGDNAIVPGAGTIGIAIAITLRKFGASKVIISETDETRASLGFQVIDPVKTDMGTFGQECCRTGGFDWVYDLYCPWLYGYRDERSFDGSGQSSICKNHRSDSGSPMGNRPGHEWGRDFSCISGIGLSQWSSNSGRRADI